MSEPELLHIAERSRRQSDADLLVANTLEEMHQVAFLCSRDGKVQRVTRDELPVKLIQVVEVASDLSTT